MGRKTPIPFNLQKYVEKHCNGSQSVHNTDPTVPDLIDFFGDD